MVLWVGGLFSHPGHPEHAIAQTRLQETRKWKDSGGILEWEGAFVVARDGKVQLRKTDGSLVWIEMEKLCPLDREWIRKRLDSIDRLNESPGTDWSIDGVIAHNGLALMVFGIFGVFGLARLGRMLFQGKFPKGLALLAGLSFVGFFCWMAMGMIGTRPLPPGEWIDWDSGEVGQGGRVPQAQKHFEAFKKNLQIRSTDDYLYVGSDGFPDHPMMVGIRSWQQQVPLPQPYTRNNCWRIPLHPKLADKPISAKNALYSGAIALAVNGVPIFNALNNRGEDTLLAGELDNYGGHCGRGDDYHYHTAPIHLEKVVGKGNPIAYALDGFPLYGYTDSKGKEPQDLDEFNGRMEEDGYRYYSTKTYPYINGGMRGEVFVRGDRIEPQPSDSPIRPAGSPLRGAIITDFLRDDARKTYTVKYDIRGVTKSVKYTINNDGSYTFIYQDGSGKETSETYRRRERPDDKGKANKKKDGKDGRKKGEGKNERKGPDPNEMGKGNPSPLFREPGEVVRKPANFILGSPAFGEGGAFPVEFTGDGEGVSPPLTWTGAPVGTKYFAISLWHLPGPGGPAKSYWILYDIPATVNSLPKNTKGIGKAGYNDKKQSNYDPMKSKGPGVKEYHVTLYALSSRPEFHSEKVTRDDLLKAIKDITLGETTLTYTYERKSQ